MTLRRVRVFFYGLFMDADLLRNRGVEPATVRRASIADHSLRIGQRAAVVPDPRGRVHGILMELTHDEIEMLYSEPSVRMYRPEPVAATLEDGSLVPALCFNLPVPPGPEEKNPEYAAKLRDLAQRLGLPGEYVEGIA